MPRNSNSGRYSSRIFAPSTGRSPVGTPFWDDSSEAKVYAEVDVRFREGGLDEPKWLPRARLGWVGAVALDAQFTFETGQFPVEAIQAQAGLGVGTKPLLPFHLGRAELLTPLLQLADLAGQALALGPAQALEAIGGVGLVGCPLLGLLLPAPAQAPPGLLG